MKDSKIIHEVILPKMADKPGPVTLIWKWKDNQGRIRRIATTALKEMINAFFNEN